MLPNLVAISTLAGSFDAIPVDSHPEEDIKSNDSATTKTLENKKGVREVIWAFSSSLKSDTKGRCQSKQRYGHDPHFLPLHCRSSRSVAHRLLQSGRNGGEHLRGSPRRRRASARFRSQVTLKVEGGRFDTTQTTTDEGFTSFNFLTTTWLVNRDLPFCPSNAQKATCQARG